MSPRTAARASTAELQAAVARGLAFVAAGLGRAGEWPSRRHEQPDRSDPGRYETSPFVTALGVLALLPLDDPAADAIRRRSAKHLLGTMHPPGLWRYYRDAPFDVDTSSIATLAVERRHPWLSEGRNVLPLLRARDADGRFRLWLIPRCPMPGEIDAVVNANAVAFLGDRHETAAAIRWIAEASKRDRASEFSWYYRDSLDLAIAVQRAVDAGVAALRDAALACAARAAARIQRNADGLSPHRLAQAIVAAYWAPSACEPETLVRAKAQLLARQRADGSWPPGLLWVGAWPPDPPTQWYSSELVTTAHCAWALAIA